MKLFFSLILVYLFGGLAVSQENKLIVPAGLEKLVVIKPTGEMIDDLPEMVILSDTTQEYRDVDHLFNNSFLTESVELYFLAANYLKNKNGLQSVEPAYLALTQHDGGYAEFGFMIKIGEGHIDKSNAPYIDIVQDRIESNQNKLMSVTQLYPHEMGHLIYGLLNKTKDNEVSRSVDMHYFSLRTDYSTAFNEGFSEQIENIARLYEKNDSIKNGIFADLERIKGKSQNLIRGFEKDLRNPLRMGYYKMSMPIWYQQFEDCKRHEHAINGTVRYANATMDLRNIEDQLTYRNSGVRQNEGELRNYVQMLSTEGVISAFFTRLTQSDLGNHYLDSSFYKAFMVDTTETIKSPEEIFTPIQNQFLKYFFVFHNYMTDKDFSQSQLVDFVEGYSRAFPSEEDGIRRVFKDATQLDYTNELPPDLWLMVKNHPHRMLVLDAYNAITMPVYTFDVNAGEEEDWLTIKGIQKEEAARIIDYRNANGFFTSLDQIKQIDGLSSETVNQILESEFDEEYFEGLTIPDLTFSALLTKPLLKLLLRSLTYFALIFGLVYGFFLFRQKLSFRKLLFIGFRYLILWILFVLAGLIFVVMTEQAWIFLLLLCCIIIGLSILIFRKNKPKMWPPLFATVLMGLLIFVSILS